MKYKLITIIFLSFLQILYSEEKQSLLTPMYNPPLGWVYKIVVDKNGVIFIGTQNGVFCSKNDGDSWEQILDCGKYVQHLNFDDGNNLIVSVSGLNGINYPEGFYKTPDCGKTWSYIRDDTTGILLIDTIRNNHYYKTFSFEKSYKWNVHVDYLNIYSSSNSGKSWNLINNSIYDSTFDLNPWIFNIVYDSIMLLGYNRYKDPELNNNYISFSSDIGKNWCKPKLIPGYSQSLIVLKDNSLICHSKDGIYTSSDMGDTWQNVLTKTGIRGLVMNVDSSFTVLSYDGIYISKDKSFHLQKQSNLFLELFKILPKGRFLGSNGYQIFVSDDSGKTWRESMKGFSAANIFHFTFAPNGDIYCLNGQDCYRSLDEMKTWEKIDFEGKIIDISFDPEGNIYASENFGGYSNLYRSTDNGYNWEKVNKDFTFPGILSRIIFARNGNIVCNSNTYQYCISKDGGNTWEKKSSELATILLSMNSEGHLFGTANHSSLTRSTDNGETWSIIRDKDYDILSFYTRKIIFHPWDSTGYILGEDFLGKTTDNGRTWTFPKKYKDIFFCTGTVDSSGNIFIIGFENLYVQLNGEDTFRIFKHNYRREYTDMQTAPDGTVYATTEFGGLYRLRLDLIDGLSVEEIEPSPLFAFPNPARDYIEIDVGIGRDLSLPGNTIYVYNAIGECVISETGLRPVSTKIDVSGLPPGVYFVRSGGSCTKFVKGE